MDPQREDVHRRGERHKHVEVHNDERRQIDKVEAQNPRGDPGLEQATKPG